MKKVFCKFKGSFITEWIWQVHICKIFVSSFLQVCPFYRQSSVVCIHPLWAIIWGWCISFLISKQSLKVGGCFLGSWCFSIKKKKSSTTDFGPHWSLKKMYVYLLLAQGKQISVTVLFVSDICTILPMLIASLSVSSPQATVGSDFPPFPRISLPFSISRCSSPPLQSRWLKGLLYMFPHLLKLIFYLRALNTFFFYNLAEISYGTIMQAVS